MGDGPINKNELVELGIELPGAPTPPTKDELKEAQKKFGRKLWIFVPELSEICRKRQEKKLAFSILITGDWGAGKSQLAQLIAAAVDDNYSLRRNVFLQTDAKEIAKGIDKLDANPAPILDEAIVSLYNQQWADRRQQAFYKYINVALRKEKQGILIMCIPSVFDMRSSFLRGQISMWIHVLSPGVAVILLKEAVPCEDPFLRESLIKLWRKEAKRVPIEERYTLNFQMGVYRRHSCFYRFLAFDRMDDGDYQAYVDYYTENKVNIREELFEKEPNELSTLIKTLIDTTGQDIYIKELDARIAELGMDFHLAKGEERNKLGLELRGKKSERAGLAMKRAQAARAALEAKTNGNTPMESGQPRGSVQGH